MRLRDIPIDAIVIESVAGNDRKTFAPEPLAELARDISKNGLNTPIMVRSLPDGRFELQAGERRLRAVRSLGWTTIPANVKNVDDVSASINMYTENTNRVQLTEMEQAKALASRMARFGWSVAETANRLAESPDLVERRLSLLSLTEDIQALVNAGTLKVGYAETLARAGLDANRQRIAVRRLNANPAPSVRWFLGQVNQLLAEQIKEPLFALPIETGRAVETETEFVVEFPPHPLEDDTPDFGGDHQQIARYWQDAAEGWDRFGKPAKRDACLAAARMAETLGEQQARYALAF